MMYLVVVNESNSSSVCVSCLWMWLLLVVNGSDIVERRVLCQCAYYSIIHVVVLWWVVERRRANWDVLLCWFAVFWSCRNNTGNSMIMNVSDNISHCIFDYFLFVCQVKRGRSWCDAFAGCWMVMVWGVVDWESECVYWIFYVYMCCIHDVVLPTLCNQFWTEWTEIMLIIK